MVVTAVGSIVYTPGLPQDEKDDKEEDEEFVGNQEGVYPFYKSQRAGLIANKTLTNVPAKYANFADAFFLTLGLTNMLSKSLAGAPRQAGKGLILPKEFLLADASIVFHLQQCGYTVCI